MKTEFEVINSKDAVFGKLERVKKIARIKPNGDRAIVHCFDLNRVLSVLEVAKETGANTVDFEYSEHWVKIFCHKTKSKKEELEEQISQKEIELKKLKQELEND